MDEFAKRVIPAPGEIWSHFKNNYYEIICIASDTETSQLNVIYRKHNNTDKSVYSRPLKMFMSPVDREKYPLEKYPEYTQKFRFERVNTNGQNKIN